MTQLEKMKILLGIADTEKDALLALLLDNAETVFLSYTNRESVPAEAQNTVIELAIARYNRLGVEGLDGTSYSNISEKYSNEFSESEKESLKRWRRVKLL